MAKGYRIAHNQITDVETYEAYKVAAAPALRAYGAKFLVRGGAAEFPEGSLRPRTIVIEFPSLQAAQDCYASATYQVAKTIRAPVSIGDIVIVEGYDG